MEKYVIITDSSSDLNKEKREKYNIDYLPMRILYEDKDYPASLDWEYVSYKDFYQLLKDGVRIKTAQITSEEYKVAFEKYIKDGYGVLSISCSSALSSSYNGSLLAREELLTKYKDAKIYCIDSRNSCMGLALMCMYASNMRKDGKPIEEVYDFIEKNKQKVNQFATVESLNYLKRAGRVSTMSAVFGGLLQVKPIIISDINGQNVAVEKVKGRKVSYETLVNKTVENFDDTICNKIYVANADCESDALVIKGMLEKAFSGKNVDIELSEIGPIIGASTGPGTLSTYFFGKEVTFNSENK